MYYVYVLRSQTSGRRYIGSSADAVQRLGQHNHGLTKSTKNRGPWELAYQEEFATRVDAVRRERFFKSGRGREELSRLLADPISHSSSAG